MDESNSSYIDFDIDEKEFLDLIETSLYIIDDIILLEPMIFSKPDMNSIIANDTAELLSIQKENINNRNANTCNANNCNANTCNANNCNANNYKINYIIKLAMNYYFSYIIRVDLILFKILRKPNISIIQNKINYLTNIPQQNNEQMNGIFQI